MSTCSSFLAWGQYMPVHIFSQKPCAGTFMTCWQKNAMIRKEFIILAPFGGILLGKAIYLGFVVFLWFLASAAPMAAKYAS